MSTVNRLRLYFGSKYLMLFILLCGSVLAVKQEKDIMTIIFLNIILIFESIFALLWNRANFFKKCDVQKTYFEFLEVFTKLNDIYLPRFIYGDFLYNFVTFYKTYYKDIIRYEEYVLDNFNYMHTLIISDTSSETWVLRKALYDKKWFCNKCILLKEAYEKQLFGNHLSFVMEESTEEKGSKLKKSVTSTTNKKQVIKYLVAFLIFFVGTILIYYRVENENLENLLYVILTNGIIIFLEINNFTNH